MTSQEAARDIRALSAGTIGTLTGLHKYDEIDTIRESIARIVECATVEFASWIPAWNMVYGATPTISDNLLGPISPPEA